MYYTIYKITNKINHKFYIGMHRTENLYDNYMGSGKAIRKAIKKYGKINFHKEVLYVFDNEEDMIKKEKALVTLAEFSYNLCPGGKGGFGYINSIGLNKGANNVMKSLELRKRVSETHKRLRKERPELNEISKQNLMISHKKAVGKKRPEHSLKLKEKWKNKSDEEKEKFADDIRKRKLHKFEIITPAGNVYLTENLKEFCKRNNISYSVLYTKDYKEIKQGRNKGWKSRCIAR